MLCLSSEATETCRLSQEAKEMESRAWTLHHDSATAHTAQSCQIHFLANCGTPVVQQTPYSPEMAPCDLCF
jgi:hypothetical protein